MTRGPPRVAWLGMLALSLCAAALAWWYFRPSPETSAVVPGSVVFEMQADLVTSLEYRVGARRITASRPHASDEAFSIVEHDAAGAELRRCTAGSAFQPLLRQLTQLRARAGLSRDELEALRRQAASHATALLRLDDSTQMGATEWHVVDGERGVALYTDDFGYIVTTPRELFARLGRGCAELAER